jgi:ketosteroid isomerase-like protein
MSQNQELVERIYDALSRRDVDELLEAFTADAEVHELPEIPDAGVFSGHDGIRRWAEQHMEISEEWEFRLVEMLHDEADLTLAKAHFRVRGMGGVPVEADLFHVAELRDGKFVRVQGFTNEAAARDAAGLS